VAGRAVLRPHLPEALSRRANGRTACDFEYLTRAGRRSRDAVFQHGPIQIRASRRP
jgi:hypothetical protein